MGQLAIIVMVDVEMALKNNTLDGHIYLMDNNTYGGSTGQGTQDLVTHVEGSQVMNWLVSGVDLFPTAKGVTLEDVRGEAVRKQAMVPTQFESPAPGDAKGLWWGATVDSNKEEKQYHYDLVLVLGASETDPGVRMTFKAQVLIKEAFSNATVKPVKIGGL